MNHLHITYTNLVVVYKELRTNQLQQLELLIYYIFQINCFIIKSRDLSLLLSNIY